jgi:two-component system, NtrC family, response regulator
MEKSTILFIDDKPNIREVYSEILKNEGYIVYACDNATAALELFKTVSPDLIITDLKMPGMNGIDFISEINRLDKNIPIILITAYGSIESAVKAIKCGAYDYLTKPVDHNKLKILIKRAIEQKRITNENIFLKQELENKYCLCNMIGKSSPVIKMFNLIKTVSSSNSNVLIQGECGTGKELVARAIHYNSLQKDRPLIIVDCASLPEGLLESELFGYEKGAFTGALSRKKGRIELANNGTLLLDEIGEMSLKLQAKLLRVLQEKKFVRVGGLETISIDFRLIASTNRELKKEVLNSNFRSDLYYRLNVITINVPPLRERKSDIPLLSVNFIKKFCDKNNHKIKTLSADVMECFLEYNWPGNIRELENVIERLMVICSSDLVTKDFLPDELREYSKQNNSEITNKDNFDLNQIEKETIIRALKKSNYNKTETARILKITRKVLYNKLKKFNI